MRGHRKCRAGLHGDRHLPPPAAPHLPRLRPATRHAADHGLPDVRTMPTPRSTPRTGTGGTHTSETHLPNHLCLPTSVRRHIRPPFFREPLSTQYAPASLVIGSPMSKDALRPCVNCHQLTRGNRCTLHAREFLAKWRYFLALAAVLPVGIAITSWGGLIVSMQLMPRSRTPRSCSGVSARGLSWQ